MGTTDLTVETLLTVANDATDRAASIQRSVVRGSLTARYKRRADVVTEVDREAERAIRETIEATFPDHAILGEEGGASEGSDYRWLVDPLNGTTNFYHGLPHFGTSIAVEKAGEPLLGVPHVTPTEDRYVARVNEDAFRNGDRLRVSGVESLDAALVGTGFPPSPAEDSLVDAFATALDISHEIRRIGSAVEDFALVAEGRLDAYFHASLHPWDRTAGRLLVEEAGGRVTTVGESPGTGPAHVVASAPGIHDRLRDLVFEHLGGHD